jgi:hypothetical protein
MNSALFLCAFALCVQLSLQCTCWNAPGNLTAVLTTRRADVAFLLRIKCAPPPTSPPTSSTSPTTTATAATTTTPATTVAITATSTATALVNAATTTTTTTTTTRPSTITPEPLCAGLRYGGSLDVVVLDLLVGNSTPPTRVSFGGKSGLCEALLTCSREYVVAVDTNGRLVVDGAREPAGDNVIQRLRDEGLLPIASVSTVAPDSTTSSTTRSESATDSSSSTATTNAVASATLTSDSTATTNAATRTLSVPFVEPSASAATTTIATSSLIFASAATIHLLHH